jgi:uncharacterized repeat protein (TIGR03803 family)
MLMPHLRTSALLFGLIAACLVPAQAQTVQTTLHAFAGSNGARPIGGLLLGPDGNLWGTTTEGGANGTGIVFRIGPDGSGYTVAHDFAAVVDGRNADGREPRGPLTVGADGRIYGGTTNGGPGDTGTLYSIDPETLAFRVEFEFEQRSTTNPSIDGGRPQFGISDGGDGFYYGGTAVSGANDSGTLFRLRLATDGAPAELTTLHSFASRPFREVGNEDDRNDDGWNVEGNLIRTAAGRLYGATSEGGPNDTGTLFSINDDGSDFTTLFRFAAIDDEDVNVGGAIPEGRLALAADGMIYGTTQRGGRSGSGVIFRIDPATDAVTVVYEFLPRTDGTRTSTDSSRPASGLRLGPDGALYGAGRDGGAAATGGVFRYRPGQPGVQLLYSFSASDANGRNADGIGPGSGVIVGTPGTLLYGVTNDGGANGVGTIYRLDIANYQPPVAPAVAGGAMSLAGLAGLWGAAMMMRRRRRPRGD